MKIDLTWRDHEKKSPRAYHMDPPIAETTLEKSTDNLCNDRTMNLNKNEIPSIVPLLRENADYYYDENYKFVFTESYHLKRGYCCKNGCKHCPFNF